MIFYSIYKTLKISLKCTVRNKFMIFILKFFHGKTPKQAVLIKKIKLDFVQKFSFL